MLTHCPETIRSSRWIYKRVAKEAQPIVENVSCQRQAIESLFMGESSWDCLKRPCGMLFCGVSGRFYINESEIMRESKCVRDRFLLSTKTVAAVV